MSDVAKTLREELECKKKYLYEYSMFWECNDGFKSQILEDDVVDLLNELSTSCRQLEREVKSLNAFLVHKGFAEEYIRWKGDV